MYIDAFAGTGYVDLQSDEIQLRNGFPNTSSQSLRRFLMDLARLALQVVPPFHKYIFIEKSRQRAKQLQSLKKVFATLGEQIDIQQAEANDYLLRCAGNGLAVTGQFCFWTHLACS